MLAFKTMPSVQIVPGVEHTDVLDEEEDKMLESDVPTDFHLIKDPALRQQQQTLNTITYGATLFLEFAALALLFVFIPYYLRELQNDVTKQVPVGHLLASIAAMLSVTISCVTCWCISAGYGKRLAFRPLVKLSHKLTLSSWQLLLFLTICLFSIIIFSKRNFFPLCDGHLSEYYSCDASGHAPVETTLSAACGVYMILTVAFFYCPTVRIEIVWGVLAAEAIVMLLAVLRADRSFAVSGTFAFWTLCTLAILADLNIRNLVQVFAADKQKQQAGQFASHLHHTIANVAHDLKTPLSSFANGVDVLQMVWMDILEAVQHVDDDKVRALGQQMSECLKSIKCTNSFMTMAINRCLDSTKAGDQMKLVPKNESLDLLEAVGLPMSIMSTVQSKIPLTMELDQQNGPEIATAIITDKQWLQENLLCLLSNAVKYSSKGTVTLRLCVVDGSSNHSTPTSSLSVHNFVDMEETAKREEMKNIEHKGKGKGKGRFLVFEVEDQGIGISEEGRKKLFNPFQQTQRLAGGTGLGLYSLAKRMHAIKGSYGVRGRRDGGQGSVFWFSIPYRPDYALSLVSISQDELEQCQHPAPILVAPIAIAAQFNAFYGHNLPADKTPTTPTTSRMDSTSVSYSSSLTLDSIRALLVDDAPTILKMTTAMLKRKGCHVTTAENGVEAIEALEELNGVDGIKQCDVVLIDLQMPVMDGLEATRRIRRSSCEAVRKVMIIGLSANSDEDTVTEAYDAGVDAFLPKPFSMEAFLATIKHLLPAAQTADFMRKRSPRLGQSKHSTM